ncbi:type VI secretion system Vgr family protein [Archangium lansingense]|uniref:type VI secretion system Vgr family protein n=1 Tax=Archangium lansingense TaxID=2995310 RepID=UPI003B7620D0
MRTDFTQDNVYLSVTTPLGKDVLWLQGFQGEEALSQPFHFTLELRSERPDVDFFQVVGQDATISLVLRPGDTERYLHGVVTRFVQAGTFADFTCYTAELRPRLWLLTLTLDSRIFQEMTVPEILEQLFSEHGIDVRMELQDSYAKREYCVQHQESTFDFVSRLMEDEGIFYFFEHSEAQHRLVLADDPDAHAPCPGPGVAKVEGHLPSVRADDSITSCEVEQQMVPEAISMGDYDFEIPSRPLPPKVTGPSGARLARYEFPGRFNQNAVGAQRDQMRMESHEVRAHTLRGQSRVRGFTSGHRFTLAEHPREDINGDYVLRSVSHEATVEQYTNTFEAFPASTPFCPPVVTPRPLVNGVQSARVVGDPGNEEICTDRYGRVKVCFPWDREHRNSCWIRVAHGRAGNGWGNFFLPHIGQEVLVTFMDGDPDRPVITGSVHNREQQVPFSLSAEQTRSTVRGRPSGEGEPNELRFEDKKGAEELSLHARRDMKVTVEHDSVREVENDDTLEIKQGDQIVSVNQGGQSLTVGGDSQVTVGGNHALEAGREIHLKADRIIIEATSGLTLKGPGGLLSSQFITIDQGGVVINGKLVNLNSPGMELRAMSGSGAHPRKP